MITYFFSGVDRASFIELLAQEGAAGMVNAQYANNPGMIAAYARWPEVPLVLDSGAFQGNKDLPAYAALVNRIGDRFEWVANLDVIGNQEQSDRNHEELTARGCRVLWVYQAQGGAGLDYLANRADMHRHVGLGGLVPVIKRGTQEAIDLIGQMGLILDRVGATAHLFGVGSPLILSAFAKSKWCKSADSQSWLAGMKANEMIRQDGSRMRAAAFGLALTNRECAAQNIRQIHGWAQGQPMQFSLLEG